MFADLLKKRGADPVLYHYSMERGEAVLTGLATQSYDRFPMVELLEQTHGDVIEAYALRYQKILADAGIQSGRVAITGHVDARAGLLGFSGADAPHARRGAGWRG